MNNPFLAEEISFYGAGEGAYFYEDAAGAGANAGAANAASAQNPYAVLALFDASFATFGADYAEALAAINAAIADLSGAIAKLDAAKGDENELKKAKEAVTAGALERAKSTADFAANVAERESKIAATTEKIATAMGVATKGATAETIAAALTAAVKTTVGISDADIANMSADLAQSGAANGVLRAKLEAQMKDAGKFKELSDNVSAAAQQEQTDAAGAVAKKAAAQLAKKAADAVLELEAAKKAAGKGAEADKKVALLEKLADDAVAKADASNSAHAAALQAEQDAAAKKLEDIAAAAAKADALAKKVLANKGNADALQQAINDAKNEAKKTADAAQKAEQAASAGYAAKVKIAGEEVKIAFENLDAYADFAHDKANAAEIEAALAAVKLSELAGKKITSVGGWKFDGADASAHTIDAQFAGAGVKFTFADGKSIGDLLATAAKFDGGISAAELISDGGVSAIDGLKIAKNATAQSNIDITVAEGVVVQFAPDASAGGKFSAEMLGKLAALKTTASVADVLELGAAAVGGKAPEIIDGFAIVEAKDSADYYVLKTASIKDVAEFVNVEHKNTAIADKASEIKAHKLETLTGVSGGGSKVSELTDFNKLTDGGMVKIAAHGGTFKGYLLKSATGNKYSWIPENGAKIDGIDVEKNQSVLEGITKYSAITAVKGILAANADKVVVGGVTITVGETNAHTVEVGGKTLTLADAAKVALVAALKADSSVEALNDAGVHKIGENVHVESGTVICVKKDADWGGTPTTDDIKLTLANTVKLSAIKDLSKTSTAAELVKAGVSAYGSSDTALVKTGDVVTVELNSKKFDVTKAKISDLIGFKGTEAAGEIPAGIVDISDVKVLLAGADSGLAGGKIQALLDAKAGALKDGQLIAIDSSGAKGKLAKTDAGFSWTSQDGSVEISKIDASKDVSALILVSAATASIANAQAIAAAGAKITVSGEPIAFPAGNKLYAQDISAKGLDKLAAYQAEASIATLKELVTIGQSGIELSGTATLKNAQATDDGAWSVQAPNACKITVAQAAKISALKVLSDHASIEQIKAANASSVELGDPATKTVTISAGVAKICVNGTELTLSDAATLDKIAALSNEPTAEALAAAGVSKIASVELAGETELKIADSSGGKISLSIAKTAKMSDVKELAHGKTAEALFNAGVSAINGAAISKDGAAYTITVNNKIYSVGGASADNIAKLINDSSTSLDGTNIKEITPVDIEAHGKADAISANIPAGNHDVGKTFIVKDQAAVKGTITKTGVSEYSYQNAAGSVKISKLNTDATIDKLVGLAANPEWKDIVNLLPEGEVEINGVTVSHNSGFKLEGASITNTATASELADYAANADVQSLAKLITIDSTGVTLATDQGTLKYEGESYSWTAKSDAFSIDKVAATTKIAALTALEAAANVSYSAAEAVFANGAKLTVGSGPGTEIVIKNVPVADEIAKAAKLDKLEAYLKSGDGGKISQLKAIIGESEDTETAVYSGTEKTAPIGTLNASTGTWTVDGAVSVTGLKDDATFAQLQAVVAGASWDAISAVLADSATITAGENTFKYASSALSLKIGDNTSLIVDTTAASDLAKLTGLKAAGISENANQALAFDFSSGEALDLSAFKGDNSSGVAIAASSETAIDAQNQTFTIKQAKNNDKFVISTAKFKGASDKLVTIALEGFDAEDSLKIVTATASVAGVDESTAFNVTGKYHTDESTQATQITTAKGTNAPGLIKDSEGSGEISLHYAAASSKQADDEAIAIAAAIDADATAGNTAGASYLLKTTDATVAYLINVGATETGDALVVKLTGLPESGIKWSITGDTIDLVADNHQ